MDQKFKRRDVQTRTIPTQPSLFWANLHVNLLYCCFYIVPLLICIKNLWFCLFPRIRARSVSQYPTQIMNSLHLAIPWANHSFHRWCHRFVPATPGKRLRERGSIVRRHFWKNRSNMKIQPPVQGMTPAIWFSDNIDEPNVTIRSFGWLV
jgi:hypothetical protein